VDDREETCEMPRENATSEEIAGILRSARTVAVVGLSNDPGRDSHRIAAYLQAHGYRIFPINPKVEQVLGEKAYPDLKSVPEKIDVVDIFRKPAAIPAVVDEAISVGAKTVWMQLGLAHNEAADKARQAGLEVVMNKCMMVEHRKLGG
jgi:predicted CoA-binding protein